MKEKFIRRLGWAACVLLLGAASLARAQVLASDAAEAPAEEEAADVTSLVSATNAAPLVSTNALASALAKLNFDRTPQALFEAVKAQTAAAKLSEAERFRLAVLLGDWTTVGEVLKTLPAADALSIYGHLLNSLATGSQSAEQFYQQAQGNTPPGVMDNSDDEGPSAGGRGGKRSLLLSEDFYAILAAAPADLNADFLPNVATLVKVAVGKTGKAEFLTRLQHGLKGFGGSTPDGRKLAAQLLSAVGWISDAGPYLPLRREAWDQADTLTLVLTMEHFTQTGIEQRDERLFKRAAEVCAFMMQTSRFGTNDRGIFRQASDRFVKLLPALPPADAEQLIRENFLMQPAILVDLMLTLGESGQQAQKRNDLNLRGQSLATQHVLLDVLAGRKSALPEAANLLVMNWLNEAEATYRSGEARNADDEELNNNPFVYRPPSYYARQRNEAKTLDADVILSNAPPAALVRRLNEGLAQRVRLTQLKVNLMDPREPDTTEILAAYLKDHPGEEKALCEDYLTAWVQKRSAKPEDPNLARMRAMGYIISRPPQSDGIPLTRLRQNENVRQLRELLKTLRALSPEPINPTLVVQAFMTLHSGAEVYRLEDIEAIFGPPEQMNREELMQLVTGMRGKLREQWQDPKVQQDAGTKRTEEETKDEVARGYRTAMTLVKRGLRAEDADWKQFIVRGQLFFDAAEYEFSRKVKLSEYVDLREEAFASYRQAAAIYAAKVPTMAHSQWTLEPYQMWFFVMLGASDLSQLTHAAARSDPGLKQIGDALRALPGEAAADHLEKFGEMLASLLPQVPANMRQRFLSAGLQVVGENTPGAAAAEAALKNYQELLDEVQLRTRVDGDPRVGHGQPFGLFISLEHTRQLARESGGFSKYLQNQNTQQRGMPMVMMAQGARVNYRDDFTKNIHAALDETFEVSSVTFADAGVRARDLPREGWQETPMAYVLLRAKEAAVDRIPSIQIDMDFSDTSGQVVLPVRSPVLPIDAKDSDGAPRPCDALALTFTMDEREWRDGRVVIEVNARGQGVIPGPAQLFDYQQAGFDAEVTDNGLSITELATDGPAPAALADRNWQFIYRRAKDLRGTVTLHFPTLKPGLTTTNVAYKHYQDADLVELTPSQAAAGVVLASGVSSGLRTVGWLVALTVLGGLALLIYRARRRPAPATAAGLALPGELTPFSVVAFLRRLQREAGAKLDAADRQSLTDEIHAIESAYFSGAPASAGAPDVEAIARKWWRVAG